MNIDILISGATGFLGRNLVPLLYEDSDLSTKRIGILVRDKKKAGTIFQDKYPNIHILDIIPSNIKVDTFLHLAAYLTSKDNINSAKELIQSNIIFPTECLIKLENAELSNFINTGTFAEYHYNDDTLDPTYLYSASKTAFRSFLNYFSEKNNFKIVHVIPYTIYGYDPNKEKVIDLIIKYHIENMKVSFSDGNQLFDYIHVTDVAKLYVKLLKRISSIKNNQTLHLGTGIPTSLRDIENYVCDIINKPSSIIWGKGSGRSRDTVKAVAEISELGALLGYLPRIGIREGIEGLIELHRKGEVY